MDKIRARAETLEANVKIKGSRKATLFFFTLWIVQALYSYKDLGELEEGEN